MLTDCIIGIKAKNKEQALKMGVENEKSFLRKGVAQGHYRRTVQKDSETVRE